MQKSKLIDKLRLLERDELRDFGKLLKSPYFNADKKVIKLFDYLKKYYPVFEHKKLDRDYVTAQLFPEWKNSAYKRLSYVMSALSDLLEDFFVQKELEADRVERQQFLIKAYKKRKGDWFFNQGVETLNKSLDKTSAYGANYYLHKYRLNHEIYTHPATKRIEIGIESFKQAIDNLDIFYFAKKFLYVSEVYFRELYFSEKTEILLVEEMLKKVGTSKFIGNQHIIIFSGIFRLFKTQDKKDYEVLKKSIFENSDKLNPTEKLDVIVMLNNYCIMKYNKGRKQEYLIEIFALQQYGLEHDLWLTKGFINNIIYDNIVAIACLLKKYDWTEKFIRQYSIHLRTELRDDVIKMAICRLEFSMGNFEEILELLRNSEFVDSQHNLVAKSYLLRSYLELGGYDMLFYDACNAFAQYCRRNKTIGVDTKSLYLNFIRMIKRIQQHEYEHKKNRENMLKDLQSSPHANAEWLRQKIEERIN